jgi:hypothetical protein
MQLGARTRRSRKRIHENLCGDSRCVAKDQRHTRKVCIRGPRMYLSVESRGRWGRRRTTGTVQAGHHSSRAAALHRTALRLGRLRPIWQPKMMTSRLLCKLWAHRGAPSPRNSSSGNLVKQILTGMTPKPDWSRSSSQSCLKCPPRKASRPSPFFPSHRCAVLA